MTGSFALRRGRASTSNTGQKLENTFLARVGHRKQKHWLSMEEDCSAEYTTLNSHRLCLALRFLECWECNPIASNISVCISSLYSLQYSSHKEANIYQLTTREQVWKRWVTQGVLLPPHSDPLGTWHGTLGTSLQHKASYQWKEMKVQHFILVQIKGNKT